MTDMFLTITEDMSGEVLLQRLVADDEVMDCDAAADAFAAEYYDTTVSHGGHVPLGCGEFTVEFAEHPQSAVCWSSRSYFMNNSFKDDRKPS